MNNQTDPQDENKVDDQETTNSQQPRDDANTTTEESSSNEVDLNQQIEEEKHKRLQLMADFQNYQRRVDSEKSTWGAISNMTIIKELLEVNDDIQLALQDENLNLEHAKQSLKTAQEKLIVAALRAGVEKVDVAVGDEFDREKMEAVSAVQTQEENQKNKVIAVISSAYKFVSKPGILKAAKVVVGK